jgi:hypothetical protein
MTMTTAAADTAAVPVDETSKRPRRSKTTPAGVDAELVGQLVAQAREQGEGCHVSKWALLDLPSVWPRGPRGARAGPSQDRCAVRVPCRNSCMTCDLRLA